ncbi:DUF7146 domain-containing protein [Laribacter hongkongensis]|uniref:Toprim domain-containing protein n=1 Tax=Laribacter hongkongensis TaxID=168471 RepID=A0ABD4SU89_9NEIS|nr:toprim domain-containing protein [Laribacter hongkongensis]MCG9027370.1 toprim domain-containing protein [Laribacter hongkongensis]
MFTQTDRRERRTEFTARVKREATGSWPDVLQQLGIPAKVLTKRNKPCPACGGVDRFSFIDKGYGAFVCRGMDSQGGDGFALVRHYLGCDFMTAVKAVGEALGLLPMSGVCHAPLPPPQRLIGATAPPGQADRGGLLAMWDKARPLSLPRPAALYLTGRGLDVPVSLALRDTPLLPYWHERVMLGRWPAMLARVTADDGGFAGLHRTYLTHAGHKAAPRDADGRSLPCKKLATVREGVMRGAAVRLFAPQAGRLALAEGIETALAVHQQSGLPVWACVSAFGLEHAALPDDVQDVFIFADHDRSGTGQRAGERLERRLLREGRRVRLLVPSRPDSDWLDVFNGQG